MGSSGESDHRFGRAGWASAVLGPLAVSGLLLALRNEFTPSNFALPLILVVLAAAVVGGRTGGIAAAFVSAACFDFFFTRPYYSFTIDSRADIETTIALLVVGLAVGEIVIRARRAERVARVSRREVERIRRVAELGAGGSTTGRLIDVVQRELCDLLGARGVRFELHPFATVLPQLGHGSVLMPSRGIVAHLPSGPRNELEIPVWGSGREVGRLVVVLPTSSTGIEIPAEDRALAVALADQLGAVLATASGTS